MLHHVGIDGLVVRLAVLHRPEKKIVVVGCVFFRVRSQFQIGIPAQILSLGCHSSMQESDFEQVDHILVGNASRLADAVQLSVQLQPFAVPVGLLAGRGVLYNAAHLLRKVSQRLDGVRDSRHRYCVHAVVGVSKHLAAQKLPGI